MASLYRKTETVVDRTTGGRIKKKSRKWWIKYRDADGIVRRLPGFTDKSATLQHAAHLEREAALGRTGARDPFLLSAGRPLSDHLNDFEKHLTAKGGTADHVELVMARLRKAVATAELSRVRDITAGKVEQFLAGLRRSGSSV